MPAYYPPGYLNPPVVMGQVPHELPACRLGETRDYQQGEGDSQAKQKKCPQSFEKTGCS